MYSCLSLRLPRAKKAWWKSLTSKIQSKLHNPKAITKTKRSSACRPKPASIVSSSLSRPHKYFFLKRIRGRSRRSIFSNVAAAVYVDKLFKEPPPAAVSGGGGSGSTIHVLAAERVAVEKRPPPSGKAAKLVVVGGNDDQAVAESDGVCADDAWEAMGFASPLMRGIDERAEEFIAKFRADMEVQEMLARSL